MPWSEFHSLLCLPPILCILVFWSFLESHSRQSTSVFHFRQLRGGWRVWQFCLGPVLIGPESHHMPRILLVENYITELYHFKSFRVTSLFLNGLMITTFVSFLGKVTVCFLEFLNLIWGHISLSRVRLFATPWTLAYQAPLSMGFSRQ